MKKLFTAATLILSFSPFAYAQEKPKMKSPGTIYKVESTKDSKVAKKKSEKKAHVVLVEMKTNKGKIAIELYPDKAPISVANFLKYVDQGFYDQSVFHRVMSNFMIQGGGFKLVNGIIEQSSTNAPIINEANNGLSNTKGTVAMARKPMDAALGWKDSSTTTSQFFINHRDNSATLDYKGAQAVDKFGYTVFGKVVSGMDVVNKIKRVPVGMKEAVVLGPNNAKIKTRMQTVPKDPVIIESIRRTK